ncbi:MAG TPA: 4'-phosphopantetheinyl transferase superfamily protein [Actinocrinis sp.]|nr:4'-phosphopantetheinyl transferase superfamily protein [Actinocrinis sp.]HZP50537.1 4'-phosphopantetheinyl transferase superfamily protein [Actinocrinis sp.]
MGPGGVSGGPLGRPLLIEGPDGPWEAVRRRLAEAGGVMVYGRLADWLPEDPDDPRLRLLLGRDWSRAQRMAHRHIRSRFVAARLLLKHAAAAVIESRPELLELAYKPGGRPYLRGCDQIDISLSHTDELLVVGITRRGRIGVDVELADRPMSGTGTENQACTPYELAMLKAMAEARRNGALVRLWTLKEAYSKAIGQGLRFQFTEFGFRLGDPRARVLRPDGSPGTGDEWTFGTCAVDRRYTVSVALFDAGFGDTVDTAAGTMLDPGLFEALTGAGRG